MGPSHASWTAQGSTWHLLFAGLQGDEQVRCHFAFLLFRKGQLVGFAGESGNGKVAGTVTARSPRSGRNLAVLARFREISSEFKE